MNRANQGIKGDGKKPPRLMPAVMKAKTHEIYRKTKRRIQRVPDF